jgi:hypothetical protein
MATTGDVLFIENFRFSDGTTGNKLVIVMHAGNLGIPFLLVKTTSQSRRYAGMRPGCSEKHKAFFIPAGSDGFPKDTYIQLHEVFAVDALEMVEGHLSKRIRQQSRLPMERFNALRNCLRRMKDDIPVQYFDLMFGKK